MNEHALEHSHKHSSASEPLKVPKHEIFDGVFLLKSSLTSPGNTDLERFPFFSKIRQDIQIFDSSKHAQHVHIDTMRMLSLSIVLLSIWWAHAYCYYAYAQNKHSNKSKMREIYAYAEHTRSNNMRMLSIRLEQKIRSALTEPAHSDLFNWISRQIWIYIQNCFRLCSGDQMGSFEAKKTKSKISCLGTFKALLLGDCTEYFLLFQGGYLLVPRDRL